jgi:Tfp pilus assembly protein PilF
MFVCGYISYSNFISLRLQSDLIREFNENKYTDATLSKVLNRKDFLFPNLTATAMPLNVFYARYYHMSNDNITALKMLNTPLNDNPYLYTYETLKATIFQSLGVNDSALFYSKKAFYGLPGNAVNFELYVKSLLRLKDTLNIKKAFDDVSVKSDPQFWTLYFAAILNLKAENDTELDNQANQAKKLFPSNDQVQVISNFIIYGQDNIELSVKYNDSALVSFNNKDFKKSALFYSLASKLNPSDYTFHENTGVSFYQLKEYENSLSYFKTVIDSLNPNTGKSEYLMGLSLIALGRNQEACSYLEKSTYLNFKPAFSELSKQNCK